MKIGVDDRAFLMLVPDGKPSILVHALSCSYPYSVTGKKLASMMEISGSPFQKSASFHWARCRANDGLRQIGWKIASNGGSLTSEYRIDHR